jgi:hypothetical protein
MPKTHVIFTKQGSDIVTITAYYEINNPPETEIQKVRDIVKTYCEKHQKVVISETTEYNISQQRFLIDVTRLIQAARNNDHKLEE